MVTAAMKLKDMINLGRKAMINLDRVLKSRDITLLTKVLIVKTMFSPVVMYRCGAFPDSSVGKESTCNSEDPGLIPGLGRSPREGNGNPLQYSGLGNPMDRGAWRATVHGVPKSWTRLSNYTTT